VNVAIRAVFLDRDGTINVEKKYLHRIEDFEFVPGAIEGLQLLCRADIDIVVVSNQAGIGRGLFSEADLAAINAHMTGELLRRGVNLTGIYCCPHHPEATVARYRRVCSCRKPSPGLLLRAMSEWGIAANEAVMVGDRNSDIEAGRSLGLMTYLVETGYGASEKQATNASHVVADLRSAVARILHGR
jgi:D-glycero-D-manno-heptose 1,7-bisphosphate phosphatase